MFTLIRRVFLSSLVIRWHVDTRGLARIDYRIGTSSVFVDGFANFLELLMMGGKPPETCRALTIIKNIM
jgi:hypothetical protein